MRKNKEIKEIIDKAIENPNAFLCEIDPSAIGLFLVLPISRSISVSKYIFRVAAAPEAQYPPMNRPRHSNKLGTPCLAKKAPPKLVNISKVKTLGLVKRK